MYKPLHLVTFDIPYPADYGGAIDVYYKLKRLHKLGYAVTLHCFEYADRKPSEVLESLTYKTYYYKRKLSVSSFFKKEPFIVCTRNDKTLLEHLLEDDAPILFEGLHSTYWYHHKYLSNRIKAVRMHNIEWQYYEQLAAMEKHWLKKFFFYIESKKLKQYEHTFFTNTCNTVLCISKHDTDYFSKKYPMSRAIHLQPFHPFDCIQSLEGTGEYILFHANLAINDNEQAALFLIHNVFGKIDYPCIIAGKSPSLKLYEAIKTKQNISIIANPDEPTMLSLLQNAQINVLWSNQADGVKLKLLYAFCIGRFIIANPNIVLNAGLDDFVTITASSEAMVESINTFFLQNFENQYIEKRIAFLNIQHKHQNEVLENLF